MEVIRAGFAMCGSFCTFSTVIPQMEALKKNGTDVVPIMSSVAYETDTRFGKSSDFVKHIEDITGKEIIHTIVQAEPIGPKKLLDILIIAPCTGNTLAKLAGGITDSAVTLAAKAHLRNGRPVLIAVSTNDALSSNAKNIGTLLNNKNIYFVPMKQDDYKNKQNSIVADFSLINEAVRLALKGQQLQPLLL